MQQVRYFFTAIFLMVGSTIALSTTPATKTLYVGKHPIKVELAITDKEKKRGLMFRQNLAANQGMLFFYLGESRRCMWMVNTFIPLSVAFLDRHGYIINIRKMTPLSQHSHCSSGAAKYALEMNQEWFEQHAVGPGTLVRGIR